MKTIPTRIAHLGSLTAHLGLFGAVVTGCAEFRFPDITNGQGEMAGEVTMTSVVLQSRLTVGSELVEGDLAGLGAETQFALSTTSCF